MTYEIWDRESSINGIEASHFLEQDIFKDEKDIILFKEGDLVVRVESKQKLAECYNIDETLPLEDFVDEYNSIINAQPTEEIEP